jgi:signal transduction histidine kinase
LVVAEELARRIALALEQRRLKAEARAAAKERDELISVAGHELKTPLASLELHVSALLRAARSGTLSTLSRQRVVEKLERAHAQIDRLTGALEQLLSVRRTRDDELLLTPCEVDLSAIVRDVVIRARPDADRAGCTLSMNARRPLIGRWDGEMLERAFSNVIAFILGPGGGQGPVEVSARRSARGGRCSVSYLGGGLSAQQQTALLAAPDRGGTRLGLWIARQIIEAHGGRLSIRSAPGAGVTFVIDLPIAEAS